MGWFMVHVLTYSREANEIVLCCLLLVDIRLWFRFYNFIIYVCKQTQQFEMLILRNEINFAYQI